MFEDSAVGQVNFGEKVMAIPAHMLKESTVGNTTIIIPESVASIGSQWATDVKTENLRKLYAYANTKSSSPGYTELDYPDLYIHRGSGFYNYFTNTHGGECHEGMTVHLLCDDHMGTWNTARATAWRTAAGTATARCAGMVLKMNILCWRAAVKA